MNQELHTLLAQQTQDMTPDEVRTLSHGVLKYLMGVVQDKAKAGYAHG